MTDISQTWAIVPNYPKYECLYDRSKGVKVRGKKRPLGYVCGMKTARVVGGKILTTNANGTYTLRKTRESPQEQYKPDEIWEHTFKEKRLVTPRERRESRIKKAAEKKAAAQIEG